MHLCCKSVLCQQSHTLHLHTEVAFVAFEGPVLVPMDECSLEINNKKGIEK